MVGVRPCPSESFFHYLSSHKRGDDVSSLCEGEDADASFVPAVVPFSWEEKPGVPMASNTDKNDEKMRLLFQSFTQYGYDVHWTDKPLPLFPLPAPPGFVLNSRPVISDARKTKMQMESLGKASMPSSSSSELGTDVKGRNKDSTNQARQQCNKQPINVAMVSSDGHHQSNDDNGKAPSSKSKLLDQKQIQQQYKREPAARRKSVLTSSSNSNSNPSVNYNGHPAFSFHNSQKRVQKPAPAMGSMIKYRWAMGCRAIDSQLVQDSILPLK